MMYCGVEYIQEWDKVRNKNLMLTLVVIEHIHSTCGIVLLHLLKWKSKFVAFILHI